MKSLLCVGSQCLELFPPVFVVVSACICVCLCLLVHCTLRLGVSLDQTRPRSWSVSLSVYIYICSTRSGNLRDSGIDLLKVGIPKLSANSAGTDRIGCSILKLTVREVRMVLIVGILRIYIYI